jgi:Fur family transcriptional regulator, stress-responsive regulator
VAVLASASRRGHHDVETIARGAATGNGPFSIQAVYDNLRTLEAAGIVRRIQPAGAPAHYEARVGDNHHHVVCRVCGATADVDCAVGGAPCLEPSSADGFVIDEAEVTYWGLCSACQSGSSVAATEHSGGNGQ